MKNEPEILESADIRHRVILFRINASFREGMSDDGIHECTRGVWRINVRRAQRAEYAFGEVDGIVRGVYRVREWIPAGTTEYKYRSQKELENPDRWEFTGEIAPPKILKMYLGKPVRNLLPGKGAQSPFLYLGDWEE